jgi:hypothetical protein
MNCCIPVTVVLQSSLFQRLCEIERVYNSSNCCKSRIGPVTKVPHFLSATSLRPKVQFAPTAMPSYQMEMVPFAPLTIQEHCTLPTTSPCWRGIRCNRCRRKPSAQLPADDDDRDLRHCSKLQSELSSDYGISGSLILIVAPRTLMLTHQKTLRIVVKPAACGGGETWRAETRLPVVISPVSGFIRMFWSLKSPCAK